MSIGKNVKRLRLTAKLNQMELAKRAGLDQTAISKIENEVFSNLTIETLRSIARALRCKVVDLLPEEDSGRTLTPEEINARMLEARIKALEARLERMETA